MRIRFWGTRGSIARPGPDTLRHGGNTSCVEVVADDGTWAVLDCGTGAHELSLDLRRRKLRPAVGHLLIGHTHWDHIQGFPFFEPLYDTHAEWRVYAPGDRAGRLEKTFAGQMSPEHHPIALGDLKARVHFGALREGSFSAGGFRVTAQYLHHPALTLGYRLEADGASLVYASDHEPHAVALDGRAGGAPVHPEDRRHVAFLAGADLVIHDAQYTLAEYADRRGWGHTPVEYAVDYAIAARARRLALFHHDPERDDAAIDELVAGARARVAEAGATLEVFAAAEGRELDLDGAGAASRTSVASGAASALLALGARDAWTVLLAEDDPALALRLAGALRKDGVQLVEARDLAGALQAALLDPPSLVLLDLDVPRGELLAACRQLRSAADPRLRDIPVLVVAGSAPNEAEVREAFEAGATDFLTRPIKPTLLRSRIRGWLMRNAPP